MVYLGFFCFVLTWCDSQEKIERALRVLLVSALVTSLFGIVQVIFGGYTPLWYFLYPPGSDTFPWSSRATSFLDYPNDLASYLTLVIPLALACWAARSGKLAKLGAWTFLAATVALVCTQSRGGQVAFICILGTCAFYLVQSRRARVVAILAMLTVSTLLYFVAVDSATLHLGTSDLASAATRLLLWGVAWTLFLGSPIHGVGWGNFQVLYRGYLDTSLVAESQLGVHNTYLALLAETGILGLFAFLSLIGLAFQEARRQFQASQNPLGRILGFAVMGAIIGMAGQGLFEFQIAVTQFGVLFWILLALLVKSRTCLCMSAPSG